MKWSERILWLAMGKDRRRPRGDDDDRAGMGTAFGLDASLPTMPMPWPPSPAAEEGGSTHAAAANRLPDSAPWAHRSARRSST